jgi:ABC-type multidrug transport system fused ATPase/permease subunit
VSSGEILLDGKNIKDYSIDTLRASFGLVSQEPFLFNNTIGYNIKYNKYDAETGEIRNAAITSNAIKFIEQDEALEVTEGNEGKLGFERSVGVKGGN